DRLLRRGRDRAARDDADLGTLVADERGAVADRHRLFTDEADEAALHAIARLLEVAAGAEEAAFLPAARAARLGDGPAEARFQRRGVLVHVLAVEMQARLQPQGIARTQADRLD